VTAPLLHLERVTKRFRSSPSLGERLAARLGAASPPSTVHALTEITLSVAPGEVLGLVGESGCGKSTLGRIASGIHLPTEGTVQFEGAPVARARGGSVEKTTPRVQMVHQDPFASLDPRMRVAETVGEGPRAHGLVSPRGLDADVVAAFERVGLDPSTRDRFPHQFSGGQRQRVAIARALAMRPSLLVLDEPVASLDVSIQAQVLNLFLTLRRELALTAMFISHDLGVIRHVTDRVAVLYLGRVVELQPTPALYAAPLHPYTRALFASVPRVGAGRGSFQPIAGEIPSPLAPPPGCAFHPRCPLAGPRCRIEVPSLVQGVACHAGAGGTN